MSIKKVIFFLLAVGTVSTTFAQNTVKIEPFFTIETGNFPDKITLGGYTYEDAKAASITIQKPALFKNNSTSSSSIGLYLSTGAVLEYPLTPRLSARAGIAYTNRHIKASRIGDCVECGSLSVSNETTFRLSYIDIPLAARYYILAKRFTLYTDAGLTTSPRINRETVVKEYSYKPSNRHIDETPTHEVMLMAQFGMGVGLNFKTGGLNLSGVYRNGLTKFAITDNYRFKSWGLNLSFFRNLR